MKNFKFLLATTAILSMGAMAVNAAEEYTYYTSDGVNMTVKVGLLKVPVIDLVTDLDFGVAMIKNEGDTITINAKTGAVGGTAIRLKDGIPGYISIDSYNTWPDTALSLPSSPVTLKYTDSESVEHTCGTVDSFNQHASNERYSVGGTFHASDVSSFLPGAVPIECTSTMTLTLVYTGE